MRYLKRFIPFFFLAGAVSMIFMSYEYFSDDGIGLLKGKEIAQTQWYLILFRLHVLGGLAAIISGPLQLIKKIRTNIRLHQWIGKVYVWVVFISSTTGLVIAQYAMGGVLSSSGFSVLSVVWFYCTYQLITHGQAIKGNSMARLDHKKWAMRSYALTFAAITQRTMLLSVFITPFEFFTIYRLSAWVPWIFNLLIAEMIILRLKLKSPDVSYQL